MIPMHFGTFPPLTGTPATLQSLLPHTKVRALTPGQTVSW
jgi:L-ascorbate metabolism protein UlaG (beta-lactamase superfamily)